MSGIKVRAKTITFAPDYRRGIESPTKLLTFGWTQSIEILRKLTQILSQHSVFVNESTRPSSRLRKVVYFFQSIEVVNCNCRYVSEIHSHNFAVPEKKYRALEYEVEYGWTSSLDA